MCYRNRRKIKRTAWFYRIKQSGIYYFVTVFLGITFSLNAGTKNQVENEQHTDLEKGSEYKIEKPGTITFTVGVKIKGKVEKPQVMIFLPKEKAVYKDNNVTRSFKDEINEPLPFIPKVD